MVNQRWLSQKLRKLKAKKRLRNMEKNSKDVQVYVTGVSMTGEVKLDEHNRTPEEDKAKSEGEEICNSREDD
jgi:hypothetical protein|tara:strand:- start:3034 stop:3249 length:216 start_codon:yes stop_codon:yes gene_type:complete